MQNPKRSKFREAINLQVELCSYLYFVLILASIKKSYKIERN